MSNNLITAAQQGNLDHVILCIETGEDPKKWNSQALSEAAIHNHLEIVKYLTPLSDVNADCAVALRNAFLHNNTDIVNFLWNQVDHVLLIEQTQYVQRPSPFQLACQYGFYQHALSLLQYPLHKDIIWKSMLSLPKMSNDPLCLQLWDQLFICAKNLGEDPARFAVGSWHDRPLPGLNILNIMAKHSSDDQKSAQHFLKYLAQNWSTENHISAVFPIFKHRFEDLDNETKQLLIAKTIAYDPMLAHDLISQTSGMPLLCAPVVNEALHADIETLKYMVSIWKHQSFSGDQQDFRKVELALMDGATRTPETVWAVVEHCKKFLTAQVVHRFIRLHEDSWTSQVCSNCSPELLNRVQNLFSEQTRTYFNEYQNRVQHAKITSEILDCTARPVVKKM